jgi:hypothetical protein
MCPSTPDIVPSSFHNQISTTPPTDIAPSFGRFRISWPLWRLPQLWCWWGFGLTCDQILFFFTPLSMSLSKMAHSDYLSDDEELDDISLDNADYLTHDALSQLVDDLTFELLNIEAPDWNVNPEFRVLFSERSFYNSISACSLLEFAPGLHDVLSSPTPPSIAFFKSLPFITAGKNWALYAVVMERHNSPTKIYLGSGTDADQGVSHRRKQYVPGHKQLPLHVDIAFKQGYHIAHYGLLCWLPIPTPGLIPRVRARILGVEALFTCLFFAAFAKPTDAYFDHLLLWDRSSAEWEPLCSHLPLSEKIVGDTQMSEEELEIVAALKKRAKAHRIKTWRANKKAKDVDGFRAHERKTKNAWSEKNRVSVNKTAAKVRANALESKRFHCEVCDRPYQSQDALDSHLQTQKHADRVAGIPVPERSSKVIRSQALRDAAKAAGTYRCGICNKCYGHQGHLDRHMLTHNKKKKAAKADAEAAAFS